MPSSLREALLAELALHPAGIDLSRLRKRLDVSMSVLLRELAWLGSEAIGDVPGPGLLRVEQRGDREIAVLAETGINQTTDDAISR